MNMDNLGTLIEKGQYELVLTLTDNSGAIEDIYYRISALIGLNKPEEALSTLLKHRSELYSYKPIATMKASFELRFILEEWDEAYDDIKFYENEPYVSQEVEEYLRELPKFVRKSERNRSSNYHFEEEEFSKLLKGGDEMEILSALSRLPSIEQHIKPISDLLISDHSNMVKTYALLVLVDKKCQETVKLKKNGKEYSLKPSNLLPPYDRNYISVRQNFSNLSSDLSMVKTAISLLDQYVLEIYPERIKDGEVSSFSKAFLSISAKYLLSEFPLKDDEEAKRAADGIEKTLSMIKNIN